MSDVVLSTTESVTTVTVVDDVVQVAVTTNPVEVSASTAGVQGATGAQGVGYNNVSSTSSIPVTLGLHTWTVANVGAFLPGMRIRAIHTDTPTIWLEGFANVASGTTIIITADKLSGSGTHNTWKFASAGEIGATGATGATGAQGASGVISVTSPVTNSGSASSAVLGLDQTALSLTRSQITDFTSGTVTSASTAQQAGTAVFANTSGTATYATTSGTAVFATNASTAVTISGSITQSQVTNLTTDLAGKANLAGGNALTGAQTVTSTAIGQVPLTLVGASGQTANLLSTAGGARIPAAGNYFIAPGLTSTFVADFNAGNSTTTPVTIAGVTGQTANLLRLAVAGSDVAVTTSTGTFRTAGLITAGNVTDVLGQLSVYTTVASRLGAVIRGASGQTADLQQWQNNSGTVLARMNAAGTLFVGPVGNESFISGLDGRASILSSGSSNVALSVRGATSQSTDIFRVQNVGLATLLSVSQFGRTNIAGSTFITPIAASEIVAIVRGAASQSANLQEWQNSAGTVLGFINSGGVARFENVGTANGLAQVGYNASGGHLTLNRATAAMVNPGANQARLYFRDGTTTGTLKLVVRAGAAGAETTILDNIPQ